jgi:hypothetical protein
MSILTTGTKWEWPPDVVDFAVKNGVDAYLDSLLEATRQLFPTMEKLRVFMEDDPEIRDDWHIVFESWVPPEDVPNYVQTKRRWNEALLRICPTPLICTFCLTLLLRAHDAS